MSKKTEQIEAVATLRDRLPAGSEVRCILRSVSRSGMSRRISIVDKDGSISDTLIAKVLGQKIPEFDRQGVKVDGCGMDMGFHLIDTLSYALYGRDCHQGKNWNNETDTTIRWMGWL